MSSHDIKTNGDFSVRIFNKSDQKYDDAIGIVPIGTDTGPRSNKSDYKLVIYGDLEVKGASKSQSSTNTEYADKVITLNVGANGVNGSSGIAINRGDVLPNATWKFYEFGDNSYWGPDFGFDVKLQGSSSFLGSSAATLSELAYGFETARGTGMTMLTSDNLQLVTSGVTAVHIDENQLIGFGQEPTVDHKITVAYSSGSLDLYNTSTSYTGNSINSDVATAASSNFKHMNLTSNGVRVFSIDGLGNTYQSGRILSGTTAYIDSITAKQTILGSVSEYSSNFVNSNPLGSVIIDNTSVSMTGTLLSLSTDTASSNSYKLLNASASGTDQFYVDGTGGIYSRTNISVGTTTSNDEVLTIKAKVDSSETFVIKDTSDATVFSISGTGALTTSGLIADSVILSSTYASDDVGIKLSIDTTKFIMTPYDNGTLQTSSTFGYDESTLSWFSSTPLSLSDGLATAPSLNFSSDLTSGLYSKSTGSMGIVSNSTEVMFTTDTEVSFNVPIEMSTTSPNIFFTFGSDIDTYLSHDANALSFYTGGYNRFETTDTYAGRFLSSTVSAENALLIVEKLSADGGYTEISQKFNDLSEGGRFELNNEDALVDGGGLLYLPSATSTLIDSGQLAKTLYMYVNEEGVRSPVFHVTKGNDQAVVFDSTANITVPAGTAAQRGTVVTGGALRFNTDTNTFEGFNGSVWGGITDGGSVVSVVPPIAMFWSGTLADSEMLGRYIISDTANMPLGLPGSYASSDTPALAAASIDILLNGVSVGSIDFDASSSTGVFTFVTAQAVFAGDVLSFVNQATSDLTLADVSVTIIFEG